MAKFLLLIMFIVCGLIGADQESDSIHLFHRNLRRGGGSRRSSRRSSYYSSSSRKATVTTYNSYFKDGRTYSPLFVYYRPEGFVAVAAYYSATYGLMYYDGYGYFGDYFGSVYSPYGYSGAYIPVSQRTYTSETYHLETVAYDLERERNKQLIAAVTVDITDPKSAAEVAPKYADKVFAQFE